MTGHFKKHWQADPFLMIGGEVHNSNSSTAEAMEPVWRKAEELCLNTVLTPVTWEMLAPDEFLLIACGCLVEPFSTQADRPHTDLLCVEEGVWEGGRWRTTRRLNGDETATMRFHTPTLLRMKLLAYC